MVNKTHNTHESYRLSQRYKVGCHKKQQKIETRSQWECFQLPTISMIKFLVQKNFKRIFCLMKLNMGKKNFSMLYWNWNEYAKLIFMWFLFSYSKKVSNFQFFLFHISIHHKNFLYIWLFGSENWYKWNFSVRIEILCSEFLLKVSL